MLVGLWWAALVAFLILMVSLAGWVGSGPPFLMWSVGGLSLLWWTLRRTRARPTVWVGWVGVWAVLAVAAWDGGDWLIPEPMFTLTLVTLGGAPIVLTFLALRRIRSHGRATVTD